MKRHVKRARLRVSRLTHQGGGGQRADVVAARLIRHAAVRGALSILEHKEEEGIKL